MQQRAKCSNWEKIPEICEEQEKEENGEAIATFSRNANFRQWK